MADPSKAPTSGNSAPKTLKAGWKSVLLVCRECEKRSKGPKKLAARQVAKDLARAARDAQVPRPRVVMTGCLKACPKKAFTVAAMAPGGALEMIAFRRGDDPAAAVALLFPATGGAAAGPAYSNSTSATPSPT